MKGYFDSDSTAEKCIVALFIIIWIPFILPKHKYLSSEYWMICQIGSALSFSH